MRFSLLIISAAAMIGSSIASSNKLNIPEPKSSIEPAAFKFKFPRPSWFPIHMDIKECAECVGQCNDTCDSVKPWFDCMEKCFRGPCDIKNAKGEGNKGEKAGDK